jgi:predicted nuclease of predicted toxin-antitoxin system
MKILIDENLPKKLKQDLIKYPIAVLVINTYNNQYDTIYKFINKLKDSIDNIQSHGVYLLIE